MNMDLKDLAACELSPEELEIAEQILSGVDQIEVPDELLEEVLLNTDDEEARLGLAQQIKNMKVGQRIKLALKGGREARVLLLRDNNRIVKRLVMRNPRISEDEIMMIARNRSEDGEFIETITKKKEWMASYQIRLALVGNPKTPMGAAMRIVQGLQERDLRTLAKSKNVPQSISSAAKRIVVTKLSGPQGGGGGH